jgi:hypothetical protein
MNPAQELFQSEAGTTMRRERKSPPSASLAQAAKRATEHGRVPEHYNGETVEGLIQWGIDRRRQAKRDLFEKLTRAPGHTLGL